MARSSANAPDPTGDPLAAPADFVAGSAGMRALLAEAGRVARFDVPVLIEGETGTGKEILARYLHGRSPRRARSLVAVNCGAVPDDLLEAEFFGHARGAFTGADAARPGLVEAAHAGTLFLDEVGELSPRGQALLLRVLQEKEFRRVGEVRVRRSDFRLIAATHRPLAALVTAGRFRADLFYRLRVVRLCLPPLRDRRGEIPAIAAALLGRLARRHGLPAPRLADETLAALVRRDWPGNVRELESVLAEALMRRPGSGVIGPEMVAGGGPETSGPAPAAPDPLHAVIEIRRLALARAAFERLVLLRALHRAAGSRIRAAHELGISRQSLWQKLRRYGIGAPSPIGTAAGAGAGIPPNRSDLPGHGAPNRKTHGSGRTRSSPRRPEARPPAPDSPLPDSNGDSA